MADDRADLELVRRVQSGERVGFDLLVDKYQHRVAHLVARYVRDATEVEDVTQEVFIKAYRGLANFRGESAFYTWLYRIAVNTAKNHAVAAGRRATEQAVDAHEAEQYTAASPLREAATPERELASDQIQQAINATLEGLPAELRDALVLREMDGLTYEEIAAVMECPIGTVRSRIFRARDAIDRRVEPMLDENGTQTNE
jgi:RNA polymerase sigma-70 factor (ECF subfamily)